VPPPSAEAGADPVADAVAETIVDVLAGATVALRYEPDDDAPRHRRLTVDVGLSSYLTSLVDDGVTSLKDMVDALAPAATRVGNRYRRLIDTPSRTRSTTTLEAPLRRAIRDDIAADVLGQYLGARTGEQPPQQLIGDTIDYLVELSGTRVESHDLTHGVLIADVFDDEPRLEFRYPDDIREAKRAPLLFDGQRSVLVVDTHGRARTELQRHQIEKRSRDSLDSGALVAGATRQHDGLGFFLRADRTLWTYVGGHPLLVRRAEHWTAFPLSLTASVTRMIGAQDDTVAQTVVRAALAISAQPRGAILAIVDDADHLETVVPAKDRYDRRDEVDRTAMRPETRLHHLIAADDLDERTLVRLAELDGATVIDRDGKLVAYGAIVTTSDSEHEGARTAAARTLSDHALVVLKVSVDGDITVFRQGRAVTTLLGRTAG
jgi:DNA integrity scanning protein DisA with diadenylate cyclase activity